MYLACQIDKLLLQLPRNFLLLGEIWKWECKLWAYVRDRRTKRKIKEEIKNKNRANKYSVLKYKKDTQLITGKKTSFLHQNYITLMQYFVINSSNIKAFWDVMFVKWEIKSYSEINMK